MQSAEGTTINFVEFEAGSSFGNAIYRFETNHQLGPVVIRYSAEVERQVIFSMNNGAATIFVDFPAVSEPLDWEEVTV